MMQKYSQKQKHSKTPEEIISSILGKADTMEDKFDKNEYNDTTSLGKLFAMLDKNTKKKTINNLLSRLSDYDKSHKKERILKYIQIVQSLSTSFQSQDIMLKQ